MTSKDDSVRLKALQPPLLTDDEFRWQAKHAKRNTIAEAEHVDNFGLASRHRAEATALAKMVVPEPATSEDNELAPKE